MKHNEELEKLIAGIKASVGTEPLHEIGDQVGPHSIGKGDIESQLRDKPDAYLEQVMKTPMTSVHGSAAAKILGERLNAQAFDASGGFGPHGLWDKIPAPGLIAPEIPFDPSGGFGPTGPAETIPAPGLTSIPGPDLLPLGADENTPAKSFPDLRPADYEGISPAKLASKGSRSSSSRQPSPSATGIKAPPIASQVPPPVAEAEILEETSAAEMLGGPVGAGIGAAVALGAYALHANASPQGSIHQLLPGGAGGHSDGESGAAGIAMLAALSRIANIRTRA